MKKLWRHVLGLSSFGRSVVLEAVEFDSEAEEIVATVRQRRNAARRCGVCSRRSPGYDRGRSESGPRRWRGLDLGTIRVYLEAEMVRVRCRDHGVVAAQVRWARHGARHTRDFEDTVGWLATATSKTTITELFRIGWRAVGGIVTRIQAEIDASVDRLEGLRRIGIDEISYKRGHRYLTIVVDHDSGRLVWAGVGRDRATLARFFELLGEHRCAQITHVSADGADWIADPVAVDCPTAVRCADPFHVVAWATEALDELRRQAWNDARAVARTEPARGRGRPRADAPARPGTDRARALKGARYALWKNPENLTANQQAKLAWVAKTDPRLHRGYLLKEGLRFVFQIKGQAGKDALDRWLGWAQRCRIPAFVELGRKVQRLRAEIEATLDQGLSQGLIESTNTKIRVLTRLAHGIAKSPTRTRGFLTPEEVEALATAITNPPPHVSRPYDTPRDELGLLIRFLAFTCLRIGEAFGLQVGDLDFKAGRVEVQRTASETSGVVTIEHPKSGSVRRVPLPSSLARELRLRCGPRARDAFVWADSTGGPRRQSHFRTRHFAPAAKRAELDGVTPHDLRHTCVALLVQLGAHPKAIQEWLGHSSISP